MTSLLQSCGGAAFRIEAEKSVLRPLGEADLTDRYLGWLNDPELSRFSSRRTRQFTRSDIAAYVAAANASPDKLLLGMFERSTGEHVGNVLFDFEDRRSGIATVSNLLGEQARRGSGYIVDADKHLIHFAFSRLGVRKFVMGNLAPNRASTFKSATLGAQIEGRLRQHEALGDGYADVIRFGLFADEFYARFPELKASADNAVRAGV